MITIVAKNYIKDGKKDNFISLAKELIEKNRKEEGCISYNLYEEIDGKALTFIEKWKDENAVKSHNNSEHYKKIVPKFADFKSSDKEVNLYKKLSI